MQKLIKKDKLYGLIFSITLAIPVWFLGNKFPLIGGSILAITVGILFSPLARKKKNLKPGIQFCSKKILQYAIILLGFGLNLNVILKTGLNSLPIIISTILTALIVAFVLRKALNIPYNIATLIGVGSSICGGSAIAATAPIIKACDDEISGAISTIFFFNLLAAIVFPVLGLKLGFSTSSGEAFGLFCGTAINDTSSVTIAASTWDSMFSLGNATLDTAVTVKLTRTLAIIPIAIVLSILQSKKEATNVDRSSFKSAFPTFILYFLMASLITSLCTYWGVDNNVFSPLKTLSKFMILIAMVAIGLNTNVITLIKTGKKPLLLGFCCWVSIIGVSLLMQGLMNIPFSLFPSF